MEKRILELSSLLKALLVSSDEDIRSDGMRSLPGIEKLCFPLGVISRIWDDVLSFLSRPKTHIEKSVLHEYKFVRESYSTHFQKLQPEIRNTFHFVLIFTMNQSGSLCAGLRLHKIIIINTRFSESGVFLAITEKRINESHSGRMSEPTNMSLSCGLWMLVLEVFLIRKTECLHSVDLNGRKQ